MDTALGYRLEAQPSVVHLLVTALMTKTFMFSVSFFAVNSAAFAVNSAAKAAKKAH